MHWETLNTLPRLSLIEYTVIYLTDSEVRGYSQTILDVLANSNMNFSGYAEFVNNQPL